MLWNARQDSAPTEGELLISDARGWLIGRGKRSDWHLVWVELWKIRQLRDDALKSAARSRLYQLTAPERRRIEEQLADE